MPNEHTPRLLIFGIFNPYRLVLTHVAILIKVIIVVEVVFVINLPRLLDILEFYDERTYANLG